MRLAKQHTGRREIVALAYGFHGRTIGTLSITGNMARKKNNGPYLSGVAFGPAPYCYRCPLNLKYPSCDLACAEPCATPRGKQTSRRRGGVRRRTGARRRRASSRRRRST